MTDLPDDDATEAIPTVVTPLAALRATRAARGARRATPPRKAPARKPATTSRAEHNAKRGKYADRIVGAIKTGAAWLSIKEPVKAQIIMARAEPLARALDAVAAEDKRVDAFLTRISGFFGKSSAWADLTTEIGVIGAAMTLSTGTMPAGPAGLVIAFVGGECLNQAISAAAVKAADQQIADSYPGELVDPVFRAELVAQYVDMYTPRPPSPPAADVDEPGDTADTAEYEPLRFDGSVAG